MSESIIDMFVYCLAFFLIVINVISYFKRKKKHTLNVILQKGDAYLYYPNYLPLPHMGEIIEFTSKEIDWKFGDKKHVVGKVSNIFHITAGDTTEIYIYLTENE